MLTSPSSRLPTDGVSATTLRTIAAALDSGQLVAPLSGFAISRIASCPQALTDELVRLSAEGMAGPHLALLLHTAADVGDARLSGAGSLELVWTGPESAISRSRDTATVVEELFASATRCVLVSTFAIQQGKHLFAPLAARRDTVPGLSVRLFVHVGRNWKDTREQSEILREFAAHLAGEWPGTRRPEVFYDPRTLSADNTVRASWHAKCVLVDDEVSFLTSANVTEWAQQRNVEAGVVIHSRHFTQQLRAQFDGLVCSGAVRRVPGF
jgi:hypothetical protein